MSGARRRRAHGADDSAAPAGGRAPRGAPRKLRVLVLCHEELVPPASSAGRSDEEIAEWRTEHDVLGALAELGHEVACPGIGDDVEELRSAVLGFRPDVCFNLLVEFHGAATYDQHVVSYLELLKAPYTGCNPRGMTLARDKALSKKVLAWHGIPVPRFQVYERGKRIRPPSALPYPLFVKSTVEGASLGVSWASLVDSDAKLVERVAFVHESLRSDAIAEEYVEGRELYAGVLGNERLTALPLWELDVPGRPAGAPLIATRRIKWDLAYQRRVRVRSGRARGLDAELERRIAEQAKRAYRALGLSGCARLDLRLRADGRCFFLEANPTPDLAREEDLAAAAGAGGSPYPALIARLLSLGLGYRAAWRELAGG